MGGMDTRDIISITSATSRNQIVDDKNLGGRCSYWDGKSKICRACTEGLLIPLAPHISLFCLTENYDSCLYYLSFSKIPLRYRPQAECGKGRSLREVLWDLHTRIDGKHRPSVHMP